MFLYIHKHVYIWVEYIMKYQYLIRLETNQPIYITYCLLLKFVYYFAATPSHWFLWHVHCCPLVHRLLFGIDLPCAPINKTSLLLEWKSLFTRCVFQPYKSRFFEMVPIRWLLYLGPPNLMAHKREFIFVLSSFHICKSTCMGHLAEMFGLVQYHTTFMHHVSVETFLVAFTFPRKKYTQPDIINAAIQSKKMSNFDIVKWIKFKIKIWCGVLQRCNMCRMNMSFLACWFGAFAP